MDRRLLLTAVAGLTLADGLGLQPGSITVTEDGLTIGFVPKPL